MEIGEVQKNKEKECETDHGSGFSQPEIMLRGFALLVTLTAAILIGLDKETEIIPVVLLPTLPTFNVPVTAKFHHVSAFVYSVVANSIASVSAAATMLVMIFASKGGRKVGVSRLMILVADLMMVALLFSSIGGTGAIGLIGIKGNSHLQWKKICNIYGKFCHQVTASVALSLMGAIAFLLLIILTASKLHKRTSKY